MKKKELIEYSIKKEHIYVLLGLIQFSILLSLLGASANIIAVYFNDGKMPVLVQSNFEKETETHFSFQRDSQVNFPHLADRYRIGGYIYSLGDFLILAKKVLFMYS